MSKEEGKIRKTRAKWRAEIEPDLAYLAKDASSVLGVSPTVFINNLLREAAKNWDTPNMTEQLQEQKSIVELRIMERGLTRISVLSEARMNAEKRLSRIQKNLNLPQPAKAKALAQYQMIVDFIDGKASLLGNSEATTT